MTGQEFFGNVDEFCNSELYPFLASRQQPRQVMLFGLLEALAQCAAYLNVDNEYIDPVSRERVISEFCDMCVVRLQEAIPQIMDALREQPR